VKSCGLLGRKLGHSYSPAIHAEFGGYSYELFEVEPESLADFFANNKFDGINVTIPYKQAAMEFCDEISPTARKIGSVNTIVRRADGTLFGDNTDAEGFRKTIDACEISPEGKKVIVFGDGGSSLSVCHVLRDLGAAEVIVVGLAENNETFLAHHADAELLVNTTPVGMYPNVGESPVTLEKFPKLCAIIDIIFNPAYTRLMLDAKERDIPTTGGLTMLVGQAAVSSELFTGRAVSIAKEANVLNTMRRRMENIILIGMPGSGKSTHGRIIAEKLNRTFIDTDAEIEKSAGRTIPEIFADEGEAGFRARETAVLAEFGKQSSLVIATGGGCVTRPENFFHLRQNGVVVFTERAISELATEGRPLSQGDLHAMYEKRLPMYRRFADFSVTVDSNPGDVADKILKVNY